MSKHRTYRLLITDIERGISFYIYIYIYIYHCFFVCTGRILDVALAISGITRRAIANVCQNYTILQRQSEMNLFIYCIYNTTA